MRSDLIAGSSHSNFLPIRGGTVASEAATPLHHHLCNTHFPLPHHNYVLCFSSSSPTPPHFVPSLPLRLLVSFTTNQHCVLITSATLFLIISNVQPLFTLHSMISFLYHNHITDFSSFTTLTPSPTCYKHCEHNSSWHLHHLYSSIP